MRAVAAIPAAGLLAGSALGLLAPDSSRQFLVLALIASAAGAVGAAHRSRDGALMFLAALGFLSGSAMLATDTWREAWRPPLRLAFEDLARAERRAAAIDRRFMPEDDEAFAVVEGVLRSDAGASEAGVAMSIAVDRLLTSPAGAKPRAAIAVTGGLQATVVGALAVDALSAWRRGRRVRLPVQLRRPSRYLDPGVPDNERALARRGTTLVGSVKSGSLVEILARGSALDETLAAARAFARRAIARSVGVWSPRSAAIVAAIVIGDRIGLDEGVQRALQEAGTFHVIAISGGNIAILAGLLLAAFRAAGLIGPAAMVSAIVMLAAYGLLVGGGASVDRATLMAVVYLAGRAMDQRSQPLNTLSVVAGLLVVSDPLVVVDPAFLLTFGATLAILVIVPHAIARFDRFVDSHVPPRVGRPALRSFLALARALASMAAASAAAELMLFPVAAVVFSRVTFAGLVLNFLAIPLMAIAQVAGMALVPAAIVSARLAMLLGGIAHLGAEGLVRSAALVRFAPIVTYRVAAPRWPWLVAYYAALVASWMLWRYREEVAGSAESAAARAGRKIALGVGGGAAVWMLTEPWTLLTIQGDRLLHVTFIDVGQGDSAFVTLPSGSTMLVDAGGLPGGSAFDIGDRVVAPVLREAGLRRLDALAVTHGDPDHMGGAPAIVGEFRPREILEGVPVPRFAPLGALRSEATDLGIAWKTVRAGDHAVVDGVEVSVRHPPPPEWERQKVRNDDSIVLELRWRDLSVLLTGDIGRASERAITGTIPPARLRIVKVPHHGSLTSSSIEFLQAIAPTVAVVSVGRSNHFGHPAEEVLSRYHEVGTEIFRTDRDGAVTVDSDGHSVSVSSFTGRTFAAGQRQ